VNLTDFDHALEESIFDAIERLRRPHEKPYQAARRITVSVALRRACGVKKEAARLLNMDPDSLSHYLGSSRDFGEAA
jgi:hypothetical protein